MIKVNNGLLQATKAKYQAEILECIATLEIYFTNAVAIGEHPDLLAEATRMTLSIEPNDDKQLLSVVAQTVQVDDSVRERVRSIFGN